MEYVYTALILSKLGKEVNEENVKKVLEAAGAQVEDAQTKALVSALKDVDIEKEIKEAATVPVAAAAPAAGEATEEKKEEKKEEEDKKSEEQAAAGLGALFG
jgi:large subunit ribosomal protein L12